MPEKYSVAGIAWRDGNILLMRRLPGGSIGGLWEFPGGKVEEGEQPPDALSREWMEETGLNVSVGDELARGGFLHNGQSFTLIAFSVVLPSDDSEPELIEHDSYRWVSPEKL
ncbi:MAG: NUDIX domain-containing protein, partial [Spirochaetaceae bacterium]|nr:NUDIX domain-containing protein [Spirochaetaceae bacterium]